MRVLVPSHGLDSITRDMLQRVTELSHGAVDCIAAGPGEVVEAPEIHSKADFHAVRAYRRIMRRENIATTFSPSTSGLATMLWASIGLGIRNIGYRGTQAKVRRSDPTNMLALLNPRVSHIVCETRDILEALAPKIGRGRLSVATKPFSIEWADAAMKAPLRAEGVRGSDFKLIFVGVSEGRPHKGLRTLLEAMRLLVKDEDGYRLTVVGNAGNADMTYASDLPVSFVPTTRDAIRYMPGSDLYILPSTRDASPRTVREAQACGVPCIVSDIPGARDLIEPGTSGLLVPPSSPGALAEAIRTLRHNLPLLKSMASGARPHIIRNFDPEAYARHFLNLFQST